MNYSLPKMKRIEFFTDPRTGEAMFQIVGESIARQLTENDREIIEELLRISETFYPEQFTALGREYAASARNRKYYDFLRARRIANCCFGTNESHPDIDEQGNCQFEDVPCPRKAECKYYRIICHPTFSTSLSDRELQVMQLIFQNESSDQIADHLYLSVHTVRNHRKNALRKLGLHSTEEFIDLAHRTKMFER